MSEEKELHVKEFTGYWIPRRVVELFEAGTINAKEMILLPTIDSLSKTEKGCFASNEYFGKLLNTGRDRVRQMISHLKTLGLVKMVSFDGRERQLRVYWDALDQDDSQADREEVTEPPGNKLPNPPGINYPLLNKSIGKEEEELVPSEPTRAEPANGPGDEPPGRTAIPPRPSKPSRPPQQKQKNGRNSNGRPPLDADPSPPELEPLDGNDEFSLQAARYLHGTLIESRSEMIFPNSKSKRRPITVERLKEDSVLPLLTNGVATRKEIQELLKWHRKWHSESFTPMIGSSGDLYARWGQLKAAMDRWNRRVAEGNGNGRSDNRIQEGPSDEERRDTMMMRVRAEMSEKCTTDDMEDFTEAFNVLAKRFGCRDLAPLVDTQEQVDDVLDELGMDRGRFPLRWFKYRR